MQRNPLGAYTAALAAVRTPARHMEGADHMEHLLLKGIHICFLSRIKLIAVKDAF